MEGTVRLDICHRPLRIAWALRRNNFDALRKAIRWSYCLYGGRYNPIVVIDDREQARSAIEGFRADLIYPIGDEADVTNYPNEFPHIQTPFYGTLFLDDEHQPQCQALDMLNMYTHWRTEAQWKEFKDSTPARVYAWDESDPLSDIFLMQFGAFPPTSEVPIPYEESYTNALDATRFVLDNGDILPDDIFDRASIVTTNTLRMQEHYSVRTNAGIHAGLFVGRADSFDDLVTFWNLRASGTSAWFVDLNYVERYKKLIPKLTELLAESFRPRFDEDRHLTVWSKSSEGLEPLELDANTYYVSLHDGRQSIESTAPMMYINDTSTLGVVSNANGKPTVNFSLGEKKFSTDRWFFRQHVVASITLLGLVRPDEDYTFSVPFVPELNEFYSRAMHYNYKVLRVEPERIGLVVETSTHDSLLNAVSTTELAKKIFEMAGYTATLSNSGRMLKQLITQLGGLQGARAFKIPGVRDLIKSYGPRKGFTRNEAHQKITGSTLVDPPSRFSDHTRLFLERRDVKKALTPPDVFTYLVDKGLFRLGFDIECATCEMTSWISIDALQEHVTCELCGSETKATKQIHQGSWTYRRSGVLGAERNVQGAVPVALALQQLGTTLSSTLGAQIYSPSLTLSRIGNTDSDFEVDFVWLSSRSGGRRPSLVLAECKDVGPIDITDFRRDVETMRTLLDSFPARRIAAFALFVKLSPFSQDEIAAAKTLNAEWKKRVILLTPRELEPYFFTERANVELGMDFHVSSIGDMASYTSSVYFDEE